MKDIFSLKDKVVCLIGGTGLIGSAIREGLVNAGANVFIGCRTIQSKSKDKIQSIKMDISDTISIKKYFKKVYEYTGKIDILVNSAFPQVDYSSKEIDEIKREEMSHEIDSHLLGYFECCRTVFGYLKKNPLGGSIVNLGSIMGGIAPKLSIYDNTEINFNPTYPIIKSGIHSMTNYFAILGAKCGVRANTVAPGGVFDSQSDDFVKKYSTRVPMGRMAKAKEVVGAVIFLASDAASYITGQILYVDGGLSCW